MKGSPNVLFLFLIVVTVQRLLALGFSDGAGICGAWTSPWHSEKRQCAFPIRYTDVIYSDIGQEEKGEE